MFKLDLKSDRLELKALNPINIAEERKETPKVEGQ
jgi:hypothetical protein